MGNLYAIVGNCVPPTGVFADPNLGWYLVPAISWSILGFATLWFLGFLLRALYHKRRWNEDILLEREPEFESADGADSAAA